MMDKKNEQYKIAYSKKRIELRNIWKDDRRSLQGCKMLISAEEAEARKKQERNLSFLRNGKKKEMLEFVKLVNDLQRLTFNLKTFTVMS